MKIKHIVWIILIFFILASCGIAKEEKIIITEIMYSPEGADTKHEWLEIFNSSDNPIDLSDWKFFESEVNHKLTLHQGNKNLSSKKYAIIADDAETFLSDYPDYDGTVFDSSFSLHNDGEVIALKDDEEKIVSEVAYSDKYGADGNGHSLEKDDDSWRESYILGGTPGEKNSEKPEPKEYGKDIRINELLPNPEESPEKKNEYVEMYNFGSDDIDLTEWLLEDKTGTYKLSGVIDSEKYIAFYDTVSLNNTGDEIRLVNPNGEIASEVIYSETQENYSYSFDGKDWQWTSFITPNKENKFNELKEYTDKIYLNEILPNPSGEEEKKEYVEIYNPTEDDIDLAGWMLRDASSSGKYVFLEDTIMETRKYLVIYRKDFKIALNNSGEEKVYLIDPNGKIVSVAAYLGSDENISYNFDGKKWRWSRFLTPGKKNKFNNLPQVEVKKDKNVYKNVYADFEVKSSDPDKDKLKFTWDFGDGHKSYLKETRHKYLKTGNYEVSIKVSDGSEEVIRKVKIEVKKFPHQDVKIVGLSPNPAGKDSIFEWIDLKNESNGEVNLKSWSIATGWKILYNHPIYEKLIIKAGEIERLTRDMCLFTLNNKKTKIELRYPNGEIADDLEYDKKKESVKEDEIYEEIDGEWEWIKTVVDIEDVKTEESLDFAQGGKIYEEILDEFLGKQSLDPNKKDFKVLLISFRGNIGLSEKIINNQGIVLGVSTVKHDGPAYIFTRNDYSEEHYLIKFLKSLGLKINSLANKVILILI